MRLSCGTRVSPNGDVAVLSAQGEVDVATAPVLRRALDGLDPAAQTVVVDLAGVTFLDSTGLGVLIGARRRFLPSGVRMLVINAIPTVWRVFKITGLIEPLRVHAAPEPPEVIDPFAFAAAS
jgi:anti-sigma B factor antagonist